LKRESRVINPENIEKIKGKKQKKDPLEANSIDISKFKMQQNKSIFPSEFKCCQELINFF